MASIEAQLDPDRDPTSEEVQGGSPSSLGHGVLGAAEISVIPGAKKAETVNVDETEPPSTVQIGNLVSLWYVEKQKARHIYIAGIDRQGDTIMPPGVSERLPTDVVTTTADSELAEALLKKGVSSGTELITLQGKNNKVRILSITKLDDPPKDSEPDR